MLRNKENNHKSRYRIKLLADNNVVMLEADNYEAEIFTPHIVNGRLTFLNIIPNRRCCQITSVSNINSKSFVLKEGKQVPKNGMSTKLGRYSAAQDAIAMPAPLANSTPDNIKLKYSSGLFNNYHSSYSNASRTSYGSTLSTPEPVRRAATVRPQILENSTLNLARGIKVARIYPKANEYTPKKVGRLVASSLNSSRSLESPNVSLLNGSFNLMNASIVSSRKSTQSRNNLAVVDSINRWRKVLTPVRTYTRTSKQPVMLQRPKIISSAKKPQIPYRPSYLVNPTQAPTVTKRVEIKKCKLLIDKKLCISPKTFKRQQQQKQINTCQIISKSLLIPKTPRCYRDTLAMSAFDLLTNSNRKRCISDKLNKQFRLGCVNKASSTYSKYKILCSIPALQHDEQVEEISRLSL